MDFSSPLQRASLRRPQSLNFANQVRIVDSDKAAAAERSTASIFPATDGSAQQPAWIAFDRQVLRFEGFFVEPVFERREEQSRVRKCKILYYLEDDTIQVNEPAQENSGIPQGTLIRRHRIPKPAPNDDQVYTVADLNLGNEVSLYSKTIRIIKCDKFTENFLTKLGIRVNPTEDYPQDAYSDTREALKANVAPKRPYEHYDTRGQFLKHDRQVLRFNAMWDDTENEFGDIHKLVVHYYLADDTIEILEVLPPNSGRDAPSIFLKRQKLPRVTPDMPLPGARTERTILNVFGPALKGNRHLLDSLKTGSQSPTHYYENELQIGTTLNAFGRAVVLCDCDEFTKTYYSVKYGIEDFSPIPIPEPTKPVYKQTIPPYNGFGSEEDSLGNCTRLVPKPPFKDLSKFWNKDTHAIESEQLRFVARLDTTKPIDLDRRFIITYFIVDDTVLVYEPQQRNSGIASGKFLQQGKYKLADQSRYFEATDFYIGARIELNKFKFVLVDADDYAFSYMERHKFPYSNPERILQKLQDSIGGKQQELVDALTKADTAGTGKVPAARFTLVLNRIADCHLNDHEIRTLVNAFSGDDHTQVVDTSETSAALQFRNIEKFGSLGKAFLFHDKDHNGFLDKEELRTVCFELNIPITPAVIDKIFEEVDPSGKGVIDYAAFSKYFDWRDKELPSSSFLTQAGDHLSKKLQTNYLEQRAPTRDKSISIAAFTQALFE